MPDKRWYACVYQSEKRIIYGRAPLEGTTDALDTIKRSLRFHNLIGLHSPVFLRSHRFVKNDVATYCEEQMDKDAGELAAFRKTKIDLDRR